MTREKNRKNSRSATRIFLFSLFLSLSSLFSLSSRSRNSQVGKRGKEKEEREEEEEKEAAAIFFSRDHSRSPDQYRIHIGYLESVPLDLGKCRIRPPSVEPRASLGTISKVKSTWFNSYSIDLHCRTISSWFWWRC